MIEMFNEVDVRGSGVIYASTFEQIKKMYAVDPEKAGELAISAIEMVLTGQISTDDYMIDMMLTTAKAVNENNVAKYESRVEGARQKKVRDLKLAEIADLLRAGWKQREIGEKLGMSQQNISYRIGVIRAQYPELLQPQGTETAQTILPKNVDSYQNTNDFTNAQTNSLQNGTPRIPDESPVQTFYQNSECLPKSVQTKVDLYQKTKSRNHHFSFFSTFYKLKPYEYGKH